MTTYMTTYPTLRQRIRLADAIVLTDRWQVGATWRDEFDDDARALGLATVQPTRVLKGESDEQLTVLTADPDAIASVFDGTGAAILLLQHDSVAQQYVLLFGTVLTVDGNIVRVPDDVIDDSAGGKADLTLDDFAEMVRAEVAVVTGNAEMLARYEAEVLASPMPPATELAGDTGIPTDPPAGPRYAEPDPDE
jgi:hypothetical protein